MLPSVRQRFLILAAVVAGGVVYLQGADVARAADGAQPCTLIFAASPWKAWGTFLALSIPVALVGALAVAAGNHLAGAFTIGMALLFPAVRGGSIEPWLRAASGPYDYLLLGAEAVLWALLAVAALLLCSRVSPALRPCVPAWWRVRSSGPGSEAVAPPVEPTPREPSIGTKLLFLGAFLALILSAQRVFSYPYDPRSFYPLLAGYGVAVMWTIWSACAWPQFSGATGSGTKSEIMSHSILGCGVAVCVALIVEGLLVRSTDVWQVVWALMAAFAVAGLWSRLCFPRVHPWGVLISPFVAAGVAYAWAAFTTPGTPEALLGALYRDTLPQAALPLPVCYASAGLAGAALGLGWYEGVARVFSVPETR